MISISPATGITRYSAYIVLSDGAVLDYSHQEFKPAKDWLAIQVANNPTSENYAIFDEYELSYHHASWDTNTKKQPNDPMPKNQIQSTSQSTAPADQLAPAIHQGKCPQCGKAIISTRPITGICTDCIKASRTAAATSDALTTPTADTELDQLKNQHIKVSLSEAYVLTDHQEFIQQLAEDNGLYVIPKTHVDMWDQQEIRYSPSAILVRLNSVIMAIMGYHYHQRGYPNKPLA